MRLPVEPIIDKVKHSAPIPSFTGACESENGVKWKCSQSVKIQSNLIRTRGECDFMDSGFQMRFVLQQLTEQ